MGIITSKNRANNMSENTNAQLDQVLGTKKEEKQIKENCEIKTVTKTPEIKTVKEQKKKDRDGQINICVPPEIKTQWKLLFTANNVTMTQGIIFAIEHLKHEIDKGDVLLTVGGVIDKRY